MPLGFPIVFVVSRTYDGETWSVQFKAAGLYTVGLLGENEITLQDKGLLPRHMIIDLTGEAVAIRPAVPEADITRDGHPARAATMSAGDTVGLPGHTLALVRDAGEAEKAPAHQIELSYVVSKPGPRRSMPPAFPPAAFERAGIVHRADLGRGARVIETEFGAIGGGLGSFAWVNHLRIAGVSADRIRVIGVHPMCYANYRRYCRNSQIPDFERLRSNSQSTPDNIWGFPGYASREALGAFRRGRPGGVRYMLQVFGEPTLAESYTPRAGQVYASLDREMARIGWTDMFLRGRALSVRKTDDGRYAIAIRCQDNSGRSGADGYVIARHIHIATGYPSTRFVTDFRDFIAKHPQDRSRVANAYEDHQRIYRNCETASGPRSVVVRGRGIVASRVIQRLAEARKHNPGLKILHSIRSVRGPRDGAQWQAARRAVRGNVELQPFNWPKACWSGDLRQMHEDGGVALRSDMHRTLGGTTTAERSDWLEIVERGAEEGWYRAVYGKVQDIEPRRAANEQTGVRIRIETPDGHCETLNADFLIDGTGLLGDVRRAPFLDDMIDHYHLPRSEILRPDGAGATPAGLRVSESFEIEAMANGKGTAWASGTICAGGPYLAVDSFLGLQYAAFRATDALSRRESSPLRKLHPVRSFLQWVRWCANKAP